MANFRDIGVIANTLLKPDGTRILANQAATSISEGVAARITQFNPARASDVIKDGITKTLEKAGVMQPNGGRNLQSIVKNPLENFASYTPVWTFACLDKQQFNNPSSYRNNPSSLKNIVFSSGGRYDSQRVNTAHGAPEYYVNNFVMNTAITATPKASNTNAIKFEWEIIEPHSMGLFLQSLQMAAKKAGYANYLNSAPYVLRLDLKGYNEEGQILSSIKPKFWTLTLTKCTFSVNENGSVYKIEAVPTNHKAYADTVNIVFTDVKLSGSENGPDAGTVKDLLSTGKTSLTAYLNDNEEKLFNEGRIGLKDIYEIQFPETPDQIFNNSATPYESKKATVDPKKETKQPIVGKDSTVSKEFGKNEISQADFGFSQRSGGNYTFNRYDDKVDEKTGIIKRDNLSIDPKKRSFQFSQKQSITSIINQVILASTYAMKALDPKNLTPEGMIKWWRIDVQVQLLDLDPLVGEYAQKFIFRVVPFLVHHSIFSPPSATPIGYKELEKKVVKEYNYIYTGQNADVLKFDIQIDNLFYAGANPSAERKSATVSNQDQKGVVPADIKTVNTTNGSAPAAELANLGRARIKRDPELLQKTVGGPGDKTTEQQVAESFHQAFLKSGTGDLVKVNLEIMGDPYWMIDSGIGNYFSKPISNGSMITEDGTMNYEGGNVYVYLRFRTPSDIDDTTGLYQWPTAGKESPFSGIYRVVMCENKFSDGLFKQTLNCIRMVGQSQDYGTNNPNVIGNLAIDKLKSLISDFSKEETPRATVSEGVAAPKKVVSGEQYKKEFDQRLDNLIARQKAAIANPNASMEELKAVQAEQQALFAEGRAAGLIKN